MLKTIIYIVCLSIPIAAVIAQDSISRPDTITVGLFSKADPAEITPRGWHPLEFGNIDNKTAYFLTWDSDKTVVQAVSHAGASGYFKKINISPQEYPIIRWNWKIKNILNRGNIRTKQGDDYPARIYVAFEYDPGRLTGTERIKYKLYNLVYDEPPPLAVINYVWANHAPAGIIVPNAYSNQVKMIVIQTGETHAGRWYQEQRNIFEDYKKAFGEEPGHITGIAIMTDTDNTGESATAWYGDISFHKSQSN